MTGALTGTPTQAGTYTLSSVTDSETAPITAGTSFSIDVAPAQSLSIPPVNSQEPPRGRRTGSSFRLKVVWGPTVGPSHQGSLPLGLDLNADGSITGTPDTAGSYSAVVKVTDSATPLAGTATLPIPITVGIDGPQAELAASTTTGIAPLSTGLLISAYQLNSDSLNYTVGAWGRERGFFRNYECSVFPDHHFAHLR